MKEILGVMKREALYFDVFVIEVLMFRYFFISFFFFSTLSSEAYRIDRNGITQLYPIEIEGEDLEENLFISPGIYNYNGENYDCRSEGLYRFFVINKDNQQRIVHIEGVQNLLHSISWIHLHGGIHNELSFENLIDIAKNSRIILNCASICMFCKKVLSIFNYPSRLICLLTLDEWNSYDNGHALLEVYENGSWKLWDTDFRRYFQRDMIDLNAHDTVLAFSENDFSIVSYSSSPIFAFEYSQTEFHYQFVYEYIFFDLVNIEKAYRRYCQVLIIEKDGILYFTTNSTQDRERIENYEFVTFYWLDPEEFRQTFYPLIESDGNSDQLR